MGRIISTALTPFSPLLSWYDRNPSDKALSSTATNIAPHTETVRATYTVPSGKKAFVTCASIELIRQTAATTVGEARGKANVIGKSALWISHINNTVFSIERGALHIGAVLLAGEALELTTADYSTDGTMNYRLFAHATEFNA